MHPALLSLGMVLSLNAALLLLLNVPGSSIPSWMMDVGPFLRTVVIMATLFLPILANLFLGYTTYHRVEKRYSMMMGGLLLFNAGCYAWTAIPLAQVFALSTVLSFVFFYVLWWYYDRYFESHMQAVDRIKQKLKLN